MAEPVMPLWAEADLDRLLAGAGGRPVVIFKHSTTCPVSAAAHAAFQTAAQGGDLDGARLGLVRVIEERPLAQAIAARFGVAHQSPQALVLRGGRAVWNASHYSITRAALRRAVADAAPAVSGAGQGAAVPASSAPVARSAAVARRAPSAPASSALSPAPSSPPPSPLPPAPSSRAPSPPAPAQAMPPPPAPSSPAAPRQAAPPPAPVTGRSGAVRRSW